jgi:hypothetical protein
MSPRDLAGTLLCLCALPACGGGAGVTDCTPGATDPCSSTSGFTLAYQGESGVEFTDTLGTNHRTVLPGGLPIGWSPDGRSLALTDGKHVWVTSAQGLMLVTTVDRTVSGGEWAPDGSELLLESWQAGNHLGVGVSRYALDNQFEFQGVYGEFGDYGCNAGLRGYTWADWSPDGSQVVVHHALGERAVYVVKRDGTGKRLLVEGREPDWSPDGGTIAYVGDAWLCGGIRRFHTTVHLISPDGTGDRQLTAPADNESDEAPAWSPDGSAIAFVRLGLAADSSVVSVHAFVVNADGSNPHSLAELPLGDLTIEYMPAWSPDGRHLAYSGRGGTYLVNPGGGGFHVVSTATATVAAVWGQ